jgi:chromosome segregation ATPase
MAKNKKYTIDTMNKQTSIANNDIQQNTINNTKHVSGNINIDQQISLVNYEKLQAENFELQAKILTYVGNEKILQQMIINGEKTIEELKKENEQLKEYIKSLEQRLNDQQIDITKLQIEVHNLKQRDDPITVREGFAALE